MGFFADNYFSGLAATAQLGKLTMPLGPPELKGNAPPSNEDVAAVTVACLADPATHAGRRYRPTGPKLMSNIEIAESIGRALGRPVSYTDAPEWMFLRALRAAGTNPAMITQFRLYMHEYQRGTFAINAPNDVVQEVTGREPETFDAIAQRVVLDNPEAVRSPETGCSRRRHSAHPGDPDTQGGRHRRGPRSCHDCRRRIRGLVRGMGVSSRASNRFRTRLRRRVGVLSNGTRRYPRRDRP